MNKERIIAEARNISVQLRQAERRSINPYASFAAQVAALIHRRRLKNKEDILNITRDNYPRIRMNRQWRTFHDVLQKHLRLTDLDSLQYLFGYLKRILTIAGKREFEERKKGGSSYGGKSSYNNRGKNNYHGRNR